MTTSYLQSTMPGTSPGHQDEEAGLFCPERSHNQEGKRDIYSQILISIILKMQQYLKIGERRESRIRNRRNSSTNMRACAQARAGLKILKWLLIAFQIDFNFLPFAPFIQPLIA